MRDLGWQGAGIEACSTKRNRLPTVRDVRGERRLGEDVGAFHPRILGRRHQSLPELRRGPVMVGKQRRLCRFEPPMGRVGVTARGAGKAS